LVKDYFAFGKMARLLSFFSEIYFLVCNTICFEFAICSTMLSYPLRHYNDYLIPQTEKYKHKIVVLNSKMTLGKMNQLSR